jgi:hypothetical protein
MITKTTEIVKKMSYHVKRTPSMKAVAKAYGDMDKAEKELNLKIDFLSNEFAESVEDQEDTLFWDNVEKFKKVLKGFKGDSEKAADEIFRHACFDVAQKNGFEENAERALAYWLETAQFVWTYGVKVDKITESLASMGRHGFIFCDDSFNDMCDSFPLHGRKVFEEALAGKLPKKPDLGENYIQYHLTKALEKWLAICVSDLYEEEQEEQ